MKAEFLITFQNIRAVAWKTLLNQCKDVQRKISVYVEWHSCKCEPMMVYGGGLVVFEVRDWILNAIEGH